MSRDKSIFFKKRSEANDCRNDKCAEIFIMSSKVSKP